MTTTVSQAFDLAFQCHRAGRLAEAEAVYRQILASHPEHAEALHLLGVIALQAGRHPEAVGLIERSILLFPTGAVAYANLGEAWRMLGDGEKAVANYRRAIDLKPDYAEAHFNLGAVLAKLGRSEEAIQAYRQALELRPDSAKTHLNLGNVWRSKANLVEAIAAYRRAADLAPGAAEIHTTLGVALAENGQIAEAIAANRRAVDLQPALTEGWNNLGIALTEAGQHDQAGAAFAKALELRPDSPEARFGAGLTRMLLGDYESGWPLLEARWEVYRIPKREFSRPAWDGSLLEGRRVLVSAEQGFGDSIQFIRYAELIAGRGGKVVVECPRALVTLLRSAKGVSEVVAFGDPLPPFDAHVSMLSQPLVFQTTVESIPSSVPYLLAEPARRETWRSRLAETAARWKIGVAWAGSPGNPRARLRDLPFEALKPLFAIQSVDFFSLQMGRRIDQPPSSVECRVIDHTALIRDFADTAALIAELDLVISVDTAATHLAGALGRPVWTLLPFVPDWRWGVQSDRTPWYPTMRLFRQPTRGDWDAVIREVAVALSRVKDSGVL